MKIFIGGDHAGYELKEKLTEYLVGLGLDYEVTDLGAYNFVPDDDYPDYVKKVAEEVSKDQNAFGIVLGGSGQGEAMCANRTPGVRAVVFYGEELAEGGVDKTGRKSVDSFEIIKLEREHNNANVLSLGARFITADEAKFACELFLNTKFGGEERHIRRLSKF